MLNVFAKEYIIYYLMIFIKICCVEQKSEKSTIVWM